jgi:hypothetical protein
LEKGKTGQNKRKKENKKKQRGLTRKMAGMAITWMK